MNISKFKISDKHSFSFVGPPLSEGPLPTLFYFALSAKDSLQTDPYNQPVQFLHSEHLRIFSIDIPGHEDDLIPQDAITLWAEKMMQGEDFLTPFFKTVKSGIDQLHKQNLITPNKWGFAGLSRGVFIAAHIAAICPDVPLILGFAPLTQLSFAKEFQNGPDVKSLDLENLIPALCNRKVRFYIGNCDLRVGTDLCFQLIHKLTQSAEERRIRSAPIELIIGPSIGHQGHGTAPEVFQAGVNWLKEEWADEL